MIFRIIWAYKKLGLNSKWSTADQLQFLIINCVRCLSPTANNTHNCEKTLFSRKTIYLQTEEACNKQTFIATPINLYSRIALAYYYILNVGDNILNRRLIESRVCIIRRF